MPTMTPAEEEKILKRILKDELEQRGFFVKIGQTGGVTILQGEPGGKQEIIDSGLTVREAGQKYRLWGIPNPRQTHEQKMNPDKSPPDFKLDTPATAALRARTKHLPSVPFPATHSDSQEVKTDMSKQSPARRRAAEIISDFKNGEGSFTPRGSSTATAPSRGSNGNSAEAARARMMQRQHERPTQDKETYLESISRRRWENAATSTGNILVDDD